MLGKKFILTILIGCCVIIFLCSEIKNEIPSRVMTFNIRYDNPDDGPNSWANRKANVVNMIRFHHADIIGIQEALKHQVMYLASNLTDYYHFGVGRDNGIDEGEYSPIFFRKDRYIVVEKSTFWLSENPNVPGKGWDAACNRIVTWGRFRDLKTGTLFYVFNTHFDHLGKEARRESSKLLLQKIYQITASKPVILTGDFNSIPKSEPYSIITQTPVNKYEFKVADARQLSILKHHGPTGTFTGFKSVGTSENLPIDFIFIINTAKVLSHGTLSDNIDGYFPSDHMPVIAAVVIK